MQSNNAVERPGQRGGRVVLAMDRVLAGTGRAFWPAAQQDR